MTYHRAAGFTIVEMLAVMVVLGILSTLAMPLVELSVKRAKERELKQALWEIRHAIDAYKDASEHGKIAKPDGASGYPPTLNTLVRGVGSLDGSGTMYWLRRLPSDPFGDPANPRWGLRSYASTPDAPKPGSDVYDVYSLSTATSISGEPYGRW